MNGLKYRSAGTCTCTWQKTHRTGNHRTFVGKDITKGILCHHHIKELGVLNHAHSSIVHIHIVSFYIGILRSYLLSHLAPQTTRGKHIGLVHNGKVIATLTCILVCHMKDALHLWTCIVVGIQSFLHTISIDCGFLLLTEIHTTCQFTNTDKVSTTYYLVLQGRLVYQTIKSLDGANICIKAQLLAHSQKTLFGAYLSSWIIIKLWVTYASKKHRIGLLTYLESFFRERVAHLVNSMSTTKGCFIAHLMAKLLGYGTTYSYALFHNFRANTIARKYCNL